MASLHEKASEDQILSHSTSPARSIAMAASHEKASEAELLKLTENLTSPARSIAMASHAKASEDSEAELQKLAEDLSRLTPSEKPSSKYVQDLQKPESRIKSGSPSPNQLCKSGSLSPNDLCKSGSPSLGYPDHRCMSGSAPDQLCKSGSASLAAPDQRCKSGSPSLAGRDQRCKPWRPSLGALDQRKFGSASLAAPDQRCKSGPTPSVAAVPDHIPAHWEEIVKLQKYLSNILHTSSRTHNLAIDGARVSPEDEVVLRDVLKYHQKYGEKIGPGIDHFKIKRYMYKYTICFWVVRVDGTEIHFSYHKCLKEKAAKECPDLLPHYDTLYKSFNRP